MGWHKEAHEIQLRRELSKQQGGEEAVSIHHAKGRLSIRERIDELLTPSSFEEHGEGAGLAEKNEDGSIKSFSPANYVIGFGDVNGRRIAIGGEDFTLKGGSPNGAGLRKSVYAEELAVQFIPSDRTAPLSDCSRQSTMRLPRRPSPSRGRPGPGPRPADRCHGRIRPR